MGETVKGKTRNYIVDGSDVRRICDNPGEFTFWKSDILVVAGKEGVGVIATSELARKYQTTVAQVILAAQQQGNIVLGWDQYRELLNEIGSLIGGDEERGTITSSPGQIVIGVPVTGTESADVKILPKNSLL